MKTSKLFGTAAAPTIAEIDGKIVKLIRKGFTSYKKRLVFPNEWEAQGFYRALV
jgi:hypothetical protein